MYLQYRRTGCRLIGKYDVLQSNNAEAGIGSKLASKEWNRHVSHDAAITKRSLGNASGWLMLESEWGARAVGSFTRGV